MIVSDPLLSLRLAVRHRDEKALRAVLGVVPARSLWGRALSKLRVMVARFWLRWEARASEVCLAAFEESVEKEFEAGVSLLLPHVEPAVALRIAARCGTPALVLRIQAFAHPDERLLAFQEACQHGRIETVSVLLPALTPADRSPEHLAGALGLALDGGHASVAEKILEQGVPRQFSGLVGKVIQRNAVSLAHRMLSRPLLGVDMTPALEVAVDRGHLPLVVMLMPFSVATAHGSRVLFIAAARGHAPILDYLLPHSDPEQAWKALVHRPERWTWDSSLLRSLDAPECDAALERLSPHVPIALVRTFALENPRSAGWPVLQSVILDQTLPVALPTASVRKRL